MIGALPFLSSPSKKKAVGALFAYVTATRISFLLREKFNAIYLCFSKPFFYGSGKRNASHTLTYDIQIKYLNDLKMCVPLSFYIHPVSVFFSVG